MSLVRVTQLNDIDAIQIDLSQCEKCGMPSGYIYPVSEFGSLPNGDV